MPDDGTADSTALLPSSGVTDGGRAALPGKPIEKTGPPLADSLIFSILLVFSRLLFLCVLWGVFVFFSLYRHPGSPSFLNFFLSVWLVDPLRW